MTNPLFHSVTDPPPDPDPANEAAVLEALFRAHYREVYGLIYRYVRSPAVAEELVQDAYLALWDRRDRWGSTDDLRGYLFTAARNRAISHLRHERVESTWQGRAERGELTSAVSEYSVTGGQDPELDELTERLHRAIDTLPERARVTLVLRLRRQLRNVEIAEVMGITEKAVERNLTRAMEMLRRALA